MKKLILIDSDGTLRYDDGTISERLKEIVNKLILKGIHIAVCTARPRYHSVEVSKQLGDCNYVISSNGSEIYDIKANKVLYAEYVNKEKALLMYNYAQKHNIRAIFVSENMEYATQFVRNENQEILNDDNIDQVLNDNIKQIMIIGKEKGKILKFKDIILNKYNMNILDSSSKDKEEIWFSVVSKKVSKGNALGELAKYLNIPLDDTIAIGNDNNDLSMIELAGIGIAVSNSTNEVLEKADFITLSNNEDGVAIFLESLI